MNSEDLINWIQLIINGIALGVAGWIYRAYLLNLKSIVSIKEEQIKTVEKNLNFWKDKVKELERKTPDFIENALSKRINIREEEIERLNSDKENHQLEIRKKNKEVDLLKSELQKTNELQTSITELVEGFEDFLDEDKKLEKVLAGYVNVASGQLVIADPIYIDSEWIKEDYEDIRIYKDTETGKTYQYLHDFQNFENKIDGFDDTVNKLIETGRFTEVKIDRDFNFSYPGACYATLSENGYGELKYESGHEGAGVAFNTAFGDGVYPVYIEKYGGRNIRVYIDII